jgi:hypothetical protein
MPSENKPPLVRRGFVIVLSLTMLVLYVAVAIPNNRRAMRGTKSTQILQDLRMLDAAVDQYVIEEQKRRTKDVTADPAELAKLRFDNRGTERGFIESTLEPEPVLMSSSKTYINVFPAQRIQEVWESDYIKNLITTSPALPFGRFPQSKNPITVAPSSKVTTSVITPQAVRQVWESGSLEPVMHFLNN